MDDRVQKLAADAFAAHNELEKNTAERKSLEARAAELRKVLADAKDKLFKAMGKSKRMSVIVTNGSINLGSILIEKQRRKGKDGTMTDVPVLDVFSMETEAPKAPAGRPATD